MINQPEIIALIESCLPPNFYGELTFVIQNGSVAFLRETKATKFNDANGNGNKHKRSNLDNETQRFNPNR